MLAGTIDYAAMQAQSKTRVPVPSSSPNDPLNWPRYKKDLCFGILCIGAVLAATLNPILATSTLVFVSVLHTTFTRIAMLTGWHVLAVALCGPIFNATCKIYGRRHTFVIGLILMIAGSVWAAAAPATYNSLLGARLLQGFGVMPFEALVPVVVADLYFVHERGMYYAIYALAYTGAAFLTPVLTGKITASLSWRWTFGLIAGFSCLLLPLLVLYCPETAYNRTEAAPQDVESHDLSKGVQTSQVEVSTGTHQRHELALFSRVRYSDDPFLFSVAKPFIMLLHPAFLWGVCSAGLLVAWSVMLATVIAALFATYPYFFSMERIGYLYTAPFLGALVSFPVAGLLSDWAVCFFSKKTNIYEAEYRIWLMIPTTVTAAIGLFGFGYSFSLHYLVPTVLFGFAISSIIFSSVAVSTYFADAYPKHTTDAFISLVVVKNVLAFALTVTGFDWLIRDGVKKMFLIMGCTQMGVCLLSVPMYLFGKRVRLWSSRSQFWRRVLAAESN
ncbi:major facilitator superfamily domain-containing protein [Protomyces lactucae-debilis]|uniref:Major facilitator superfamily domain-containing protein n=1 Tax=Protomyces lactucae-debilis TaxID=2754530 RepID=A0A1Y2F0D9_PROLT|nr:major facilitator superfamily domain-containing protein [Protomyces lactucae-debilis]ORY76954.1 major facilitator superfamily domain-containing protein [Protomyces lactucae-debilis]